MNREKAVRTKYAFFLTNLKMLFQSLTACDGDSDPPNANDVTKLWGFRIVHNDTTIWIQDVVANLKHISQQLDINITKVESEHYNNDNLIIIVRIPLFVS